VGLLALRQLGARALPWLALGALLGRFSLVAAVGTLPPAFVLIDTAVELLVVGALAPRLRWRLPRAGWSATDAGRLLLLRLLPLALLAGALQALGRQWIVPLPDPLMLDLGLRFAAAQALALLAGCLLWDGPGQLETTSRRRAALLLAAVALVAMAQQAGLDEAAWLGFVLLGWLALGADRSGVLLALLLLGWLPVVAEWTVPAAAGIAVLPDSAAAAGTWSLAALLCLLLAVECAQRDASRSQLSTLVQARTSALQAELQRRRRLEERLSGVPDYDPLTGVPNRALLMDRLALALADARRQQVGLAVCCLQLDGLTVINDAVGRSAGDSALVVFAQRLRERLRASDTVARVGGDEFVILALRAPTPAAATEIAERVLGCLDLPVLDSAPQLLLGASLGIALSPQHGERPEELLRAADAAMQEVCRGGGSGWMLYAGRGIGADDAAAPSAEEDAAASLDDPLPSAE
jgi:diguanylate cyclase (GGDEF)-like protein